MTDYKEKYEALKHAVLSLSKDMDEDDPLREEILAICEVEEDD